MQGGRDESQHRGADVVHVHSVASSNAEAVLDGKQAYQLPTTRRRRKSLAALTTIVPTEDKFQKLKNVRLAGFAFLAKTTNWYARLFWILLILLAFAFLAYEVYKTISDFINNPIITTYELKPQEEIEFPKLFICPSVVVRKDFLQNNLKRAVAVHTLIKMPQFIGRNDTNADINDNDMYQTADDMSGEAMRLETFEMGLKVEDFFKSCRFFGNNSEYEDIDCGTITKPLFDYRYGKCFQVSVDRNQTADGKGLSLVLNCRSKSQASGEYAFFTKPYEGVFVSIDSQFQPASQDSVLISAGAYTKMALSLTKLTFLNSLSGALIQPCAEADAAQLQVLSTRYTQSSCRLECVVNLTLAECGCVPVLDVSALKPAAPALCSATRYRDCVQRRLGTLAPAAAQQLEQCRAGCTVPCEDYRYESSSSSAPLNPDAFETAAEAEAEDASELVLLDVAFDRLETVHFSQSSSMTFDFFVGNMGSQITLWIGGCMLTLLPLPLSLFAFCIMACSIRIKRCFNSSPSNLSY